MYTMNLFPHFAYEENEIYLIKFLNSSEEEVYELAIYYEDSQGKDMFYPIHADRMINVPHIELDMVLEFMPVSDIDKLLKEHENMYNAVDNTFVLLKQIQLELENV